MPKVRGLLCLRGAARLVGLRRCECSSGDTSIREASVSIKSSIINSSSEDYFSRVMAVERARWQWCPWHTEHERLLMRAGASVVFVPVCRMLAKKSTRTDY